ncbi:cupin domain-containing protein [Micromonospora sp. SCSIO 07396]
MPGVIHRPAEAGPTIWFGDATYTFKCSAAESGGALTFAEASVPPGGGPPPHRHHHTDEAFYVLAGELEFLNGEDTFPAGRGDFVFVPRGTRHRFRNIGQHTARLLFLFTPGGMEGFFMSIGVDAQAGKVPLPMTPSQRDLIVELAGRYDFEPAA